jgi:hypothetical protein
MANDEVKVETICGAPMPDRLWLVDMGCGDVSWTAQREPDGEAPLEAVEYVRLAARPAPAEDAVEIATAAAFEALHGAKADPFEQPEAWAYAESIATAVLAALAAMQPRGEQQAGREGER